MFLRTLFYLSLTIFTYVVLFTPKPLLKKENKYTSILYPKDFSKNFLPAHTPSDEIIKHTGYTLCYSEEHEQAKWVAYHLTSKMVNESNEERTNKFIDDTEVTTGSASVNDYKKSGYDRGHLCPAGDMGWSEQTMKESFFMSNMSPQVPKFNRGVWKNLETNIREWTVNNKELYIVTAGVLNGKLKTIGKNKVSVPQYFYKVILDYELPEYKAIAFVMPNKSSKKSIYSFAVSIDSVEHLTGIDFFPALPDSIENRLEAQVNLSKWE